METAITLKTLLECQEMNELTEKLDSCKTKPDEIVRQTRGPRPNRINSAANQGEKINEALQ